MLGPFLFENSKNFPFLTLLERGKCVLVFISPQAFLFGVFLVLKYLYLGFSCLMGLRGFGLFYFPLLVLFLSALLVPFLSLIPFPFQKKKKSRNKDAKYIAQLSH